VSLDTVVYVVDDDDGVRDALKVLLESDDLTTEVFSSGKEFMNSFRDDVTSCLLLDVQMPDMNGLEMQAELASHQIKLPIIIITGYGDVPVAVAAMKAGAIDFIEKPFSDDRILTSVRKALEIGTKDREEHSIISDARSRLERLTSREREILDYLIVGHLNKVIAFELGISTRTVEIHRARIMEKMDAESLAHLVRMTLSLGIKPELP